MKIRASVVGLVLGLAGLTSPQVTKAQANYTLLTGGTENINSQGILQTPVSEDGTKLFFQTAERLSPLDVDNASDIYMASNGVITLLSGGTADIPVTMRRLTRDGSRVFFRTSESLDADDVDTAQDIYEASAGGITLISGGTANIDADIPNPQGQGPPQFPPWRVNRFGLSDDGSVVFFQTTEAIPGAGDTDSELDTYRASGGSVTLITGNAIAGTSRGAFFSFASADGTTAYFGSGERLVATDTDDQWDLYRYAGGVYTMISPPTSPPSNVDQGSLIAASANGSHVIFNTSERIVAGDGDFGLDCVMWVAATGQYFSVSGGSDFAAPTNGNECHDISSDGSRVFFFAADDVVPSDTNGNGDAYMYVTATEARIPLTGALANTFSALTAVSPDGTQVLIGTNAQLTASDSDTLADTYLLSGGQFTLLTPGTTQFFSVQSVSQDLTRAFFITAQALDPADTDADYDVYEGSAGGARLLTPGTTAIASFGGASGDGQTIVILSQQQLSADDIDTANDYYLVVPAPRDVDPPVITVSLDTSDVVAASGWYNIASSGSNGVLVNVAATDPSGITNVTALDGASTVFSTANATGSFTLNDGQHSIVASATDGAGNTGAAIGSTPMPISIRIDQTAPAVTCLNPTVLLNAGSSPIDIATVTDATSGPVAGTLTTVPSSATVGLKSVSVNSADVAGNSTTQNCGYRVVYAFTGYGAPISIPPNDYVVAAARESIPMPFVLRDAQNAPVLNLNKAAILDTVVVNASFCTGTFATLPASTYARGGRTGLIEIGGGSYEFRYRTGRTAAGQCHRVSVDLGDGIQHSATFRLTP